MTLLKRMALIIDDGVITKVFYPVFPPSVQVTRGAGSGQYLASVLQEGRENANIDAGLGFSWRNL
jgi:hypothetical protein